jgi:hypothetical protein
MGDDNPLVCGKYTGVLTMANIFQLRIGGSNGLLNSKITFQALAIPLP